mmetsp:Transcript_47471/g.109896  ORF Transcript_47471/g.109896 Transcript_47471/m.109896 type:complete len:261 (-) Transcript_47471:659-1441(-)
MSRMSVGFQQRQHAHLPLHCTAPAMAGSPCSQPSLSTHRKKKIDVRRVPLPDLLGHELGRWRQATVLWGPRVHHRQDRNAVHQRWQLALLRDRVKLGLQRCHDLGVAAKRLALLSSDTGLCCQLGQRRGLALRQRNGLVDGGIGVAADASCFGVDDVGVVVGCIHHLQGHVLSTLQLHEVLLAVNDLEVASRREHADVTCMEPPILVKVLSCLSRQLVVARGDGRPAHPDLATPLASRAVRMLLVCGKVRFAVLVGNLWL